MQKKTTSDLLIQKAKKLLLEPNLKDKDELYIFRLNQTLHNYIGELESSLKRRKPTFTNKNDENITLDQIESQIKYNSQVYQDYKLQLQDLEKKRNNLLDSKYRYELSKSIDDLKISIQDLSNFVQITREKAKLKKAKASKEMTQSLKNTKMKMASQSQASISQSPQTSLLSIEKYAKDDELNVKDIVIKDPKLLIEMSRRTSEDLDLLMMRNQKLEDKYENLKQLVQKLSRKSEKIDQKYENLYEYAQVNQICEKPGMENETKELNQQIQRLEKNYVINKNMYELKLEEMNQQLVEVNKDCEVRTETIKRLKEEIERSREHINEMKAISNNLQMNQHLNTNSRLEQTYNTLNFQGEYKYFPEEQNSLVNNSYLALSKYEEEQENFEDEDFYDAFDPEDVEFAEVMAQNYVDEICVKIRNKYRLE